MACEDYYEDDDAPLSQHGATPSRTDPSAGERGVLDRAAFRVSYVITSHRVIAGIQTIVPCRLRHALSTVLLAASDALTSRAAHARRRPY